MFTFKPGTSTEFMPLGAAATAGVHKELQPPLETGDVMKAPLLQ
jgi:hypothetical protein